MMISLGLFHTQERKLLPGKETRIFQELSLVISSHKGGEFQIAANDDDALLLRNENRGGGVGWGDVSDSSWRPSMARDLLKLFLSMFREVPVSP